MLEGERFAFKQFSVDARAHIQVDLEIGDTRGVRIGHFV